MCVCHSIRSMFRVLGIYNFDITLKKINKFEILYIFLDSFVVEKLLSSVFIMNASLLINKTDLECNLLEVITVYNICI